MFTEIIKPHVGIGAHLDVSNSLPADRDGDISFTINDRTLKMSVS